MVIRRLLLSRISTSALASAPMLQSLLQAPRDSLMSLASFVSCCALRLLKPPQLGSMLT
jgi:hypothetical protein